jgi:hypothetical protein
MITLGDLPETERQRIVFDLEQISKELFQLGKIGLSTVDLMMFGSIFEAYTIASKREPDHVIIHTLMIKVETLAIDVMSVRESYIRRARPF